ncbi:MAG: hypothetical protein IKO19_05450 [Candidatus Riflebacteria bacterium]|nr:hypothetical protein [Candidatus Riflebacteria bacterium]
MAVYVTDKKALKHAYDSKAEEIIITGKLAKKFYKARSLKKASPAAWKIIGASLAVAVPIVVAAIAAAPAGGAFITIPAVLTEAGVIATALSVETAVAISIIILAATIGTALLIGLLKNYDIEFDVKAKPPTAHLKLKK